MLGFVPQTPLLSTRGTRAQEWLPNLQFMPILGLKTRPRAIRSQLLTFDFPVAVYIPSSEKLRNNKIIGNSGGSDVCAITPAQIHS